MTFIIVEVKDKDLYTLYDTENKGVCCCSLYTIKQLVKDYKCKIIGLRSKNGKLFCEEHNFDGSVRKRKAPCICADETKRSARTIIKGMNEKDYPKETKGRAGIFSNVDENKPLLVTVDGKQITGILCRTENGLVCYDKNFQVIDKDKITNITKKNISDTEKQSLLSVSGHASKILLLEKEIAELEKDLTAKKRKLQELKTGKISVVEKNREREYEKTVTGKENFFQDFYKGTLDKAFILAVLKKTKRPITYTYGLSYRNPTTHNQPISKDLAIQYITRGSMLSVRAEDNVIRIQEVSEMDMW